MIKEGEPVKVRPPSMYGVLFPLTASILCIIYRAAIRNFRQEHHPPGVLLSIICGIGDNTLYLQNILHNRR